MLPVDANRGTLTSAAVSVTVVANAVPTVALTSPTAGDVLDPYQTVTLAATASDADGTVAKVDFYNGEQLLASRTTAPYTYRWALGAAGEYVLSARATDNQGAVGTSAAVRLRVGGDPVDPNPRETITYIHPDVSGSPLVATNANGNVVWKENYQAYGQRQLRQPGSEGQGQWFHGKEADAGTGLQYFGARYYDPVVGRFMGVDPVGFQEDNLHSFNRYAYGNNNPVRYLDPDGQQAQKIVKHAELMPLDGGGGGGTSLNEVLEASGMAPLSDAALAAGIVSGSGAKSLISTFGSGAAKEGNFVYRGLAKGENAAAGLSARAPGAGNSPISHVAGKRDTQWISTTKDLNTALEKYGQHGVVRIDLNKVRSEVLDVSGGFSQGGRMSNWARRDQEVLIRDFISPDAIVRIK